MTTTQPGPPPDRSIEAPVDDRRWWILGVLCLSLVIVIVGNTVLNVALPTLIRELHATQTELQWIVDAYALVFAGLLLTAGALGDRYGRKGALTVGLVIFGGASAVSAFVSDPAGLIAGRAVMGLGAALVMPATLSILTTVFPPRERGRAIAIWAGLAGAGAAIGPIGSGFLLEHFWWGSVFLMNLPIIVIALVAGSVLVPTSKDPNGTSLDPVGAALSIAGLAALLYGIIEAPSHGWTSGSTIGAFAAAVVFLCVFGWYELRTDDPMLELRWFKNPGFSTAAGAITLVFFAMFGTFFLFAQYLQLVLGYGTLEAGLRMLPMAMTMMVAAPNSARLAERFGARRVVAGGLATVGVGLLYMSFLQADSSYPRLVLGLVIMSAGMGSSMAPSTGTIMASLPMNKAGVGSAVNDTTRELGGALGVAVLGSLAASTYSSGIAKAAAGLPAASASAAKASLGAALAVGDRVGGGAGEALAAAARSAYVDGMSNGLRVGAVVVFAASLLVSRFLPESAGRHDHL
ncbi:MAG TPA: MFS transporter [Acidimicrobiales bacterium]|nr:MFS transporter [Acidimicrobiales bacterium]